MQIKQILQLFSFKQLKSINTLLPRYNYVSEELNLTKQIQEFTENNESLLAIYAKKFRRARLDAPLLQRQKIILPAIRVRKIEDKLVYLKNRKECPAVIKGREEFQDLDLVMDPTQMFALKRRKDCYAESFYIQIGDEKIRTTLQELQIHPLQKWVMLGKFQRYIVGRPNNIILVLYLKPTLQNTYLMRGSSIELKQRYFHVISYSDDYLCRFEIDPSNVTPQRGYKLGDLNNALPPGMMLDPQWKYNLNTTIIEVGGDMEKVMLSAESRDKASSSKKSSSKESGKTTQSGKKGSKVKGKEKPTEKPKEKPGEKPEQKAGEKAGEKGGEKTGQKSNAPPPPKEHKTKSIKRQMQALSQEEKEKILKKTKKSKK